MKDIRGVNQSDHASSSIFVINIVLTLVGTNADIVLENPNLLQEFAWKSLGMQEKAGVRITRRTHGKLQRGKGTALLRASKSAL